MKVIVAAALLIATAARAATPEEQYQREFVGVDEVTVVEKSGLVQAQLPWQGKYKSPLSAPSFFRAVERPDLADEAEARSTRRNVLMLSGLGAVLAGGVAFGLAARTTCGIDGCDMRSDGQLAASLGAVGVGAGFALFLAGAFTNPSPVDAPALRQLADEHNQALRSRLGLSPLVEAGGGGVIVAGAF